MGVRSNNPTQSFFDDFFRSGKDAVIPYVAPVPYSASGGVISDYEVSGTYYRAHIFIASGSFVSPGDKSIEYIASPAAAQDLVTQVLAAVAVVLVGW